MREVTDIPEGYKKTKVGIIPEEWAFQSLLSCAKKERNSFSNGPFGSDLLSSELNSEGVPVIYIRDIKRYAFEWISNVFVTPEKAGKLIASKVQPQDVLITKVGSPPCEAAIYDYSSKNAIITQDVIRLRPKHEIDPYFLMVLLNSKYGQQEVHKIKIVGTRERVSLTDFKKIKLPFPPLPEQQKIATILSTWDRAIEYTQDIIDDIHLRNKGLAQQLLTGKTRLRGFDEAWEEFRLSDISERVTTRNSELNDTVVTISAQRGFVLQEEFFNKRVASETLSNYYLLQKGEFAYNKSYSKGYPMGAFKRLNHLEKAVVTTLYICFRLKDNVNSNFMEQFFEAGLMIKGLMRIAQEGGRAHGLLNIGLSDFFNLKLTIPNPEEQYAIASVLERAAQELKVYEKKLTTLKDQKKGLMQKLLRGEIRVKTE